mmetsp:Transcript_33883/g.102378  ORF Transcript_33883/g.102378 Transcript_33883/m.102378 type:complete len:243 (-) Transcript_33883:27-755(-)
MARVGWLVETNDFNESMATVCTETAWVFPGGLQVGREVQYFSRWYDDLACKPPFGFDFKESWAIGEVAGIDGAVVQMEWSGAAQRLVFEDREVWSVVPPPEGDLLMKASGFGSDVGSDDFSDDHDVDPRIGVHLAFDDDGDCDHVARRCDDYQIQWREEAVQLLPTQAFVVTVVSHDVIADDQVRVELGTIAGGKFHVQIDKDAISGALMKAVANQRQLGLTRVCIASSAGVLMEPDSALPF